MKLIEERAARHWVLAQMDAEDHEQVVYCYDRSSGLRGIIAIHDTSLGPALGGCRMWPYETEEDALRDALRLARGMTYKSAIAGLDYGGGKMVIWGDPARDKSEAMFRALGRFVDGMGGRFITGTDVGTTSEDFIHARKETPYVVSLPPSYGGSGSSAVPTAIGVLEGIRAALGFLGQKSLEGVHVAVQGLGKVGYELVGLLLNEGARVTGTDISETNWQRAARKYPGLTLVEPEQIYDVKCDVFSPNALGGVINDRTLPRLQAKIVAGAANNQLWEPRHGQELARRGILYAPDYVINAGGVIQVADELEGFNRERVLHKVRGIGETLTRIFTLARQAGVTPEQAADRLAEERIAAVTRVRRIYKK